MYHKVLWLLRLQVGLSGAGIFCDTQNANLELWQFFLFYGVAVGVMLLYFYRRNMMYIYFAV